MKNKKLLIAAGVAAGVVLIVLLLNSSGPKSRNDVIVPVAAGEFIVDITTTGELEAKNSINIMGPRGLRNYRIHQVNIQRIIDEGTYVKKGQFIASLDPSELNTKIKDTEIEVEQAETQYIQTKLDTSLEMRQARDELINLKYAVEEKNLVLDQSKFEPPATIKQAEIELDKAKRAYGQAQDSYEIKRQQCIAKMQDVSASRRKRKLELDGLLQLQEEFEIKAPEDGMLIYRKGWDGKPIKEGSQVSAWDPVVATLPDLSSMNSVTYVNEVDIRRIKVGQKVEVGLDAFPDKKLTGEVTRVANVGEQRPNSDAKVFQVTVELYKVDATLRPGMTTSNRIITMKKDNVLSVPLESLHSFQDSITYVYKSNGLSYDKQEVKVGETNANQALIESGLSENDRVYLSMPEGGPQNNDISLLTELDGKRDLRKEEEQREPSLDEQRERREGGASRRGQAGS